MADLFNPTKQDASPFNPLGAVLDSLTVNNSRLDNITAQSESNNRDFDSNGRPITSPVGAKFAMQVMPATARDPGFGLKPADPNNAADMNRLGREYRATMEKRYGGDLGKMWAAYNAGPGRVDQAIAKHGANWLNHMPGETQSYVRKNLNAAGRPAPAGTQSAGEASVSMPEIRDVRSQAPTAGEVARNQEGREYEVVDPFKVGDRAREAASASQLRLSELDQAIAGAITNTNTEQQAQLESLQRRNEQQAAVRQQITDGTQELLQQSKPIFQKREAIANRLGEIADMNPFARAFKGAFDPNYNIESLQGRQRLYGAQLEEMSSQYDYTTKLQNGLISAISDEYVAGKDVFDLLKTHRFEDLQLLGQSVSAAQATMGQITDELSADSAIEQSKRFALVDTVSKMSLGQLNDAEANQVDGRVVINGIEIPTNMIEDRLNAVQDQEYDLASRQMAIESQQMGLVDQAENRIVNRMTPAEVDAAITNGGVYNGQQFAMDKLISQQNLYREQRAATVNDMTVAESPQQAVQMIKSVNGQFQSALARAKSLGMNNDPVFVQLGQTLTQEFNRFRQGYNEAKARGVEKEYATSALPRLNQLFELQNNAVNGFVKTWAGGNKDLLAVGNAWMKGQPLNSRDSAKGLLTLARDGLPQGTNLDGPALQAFRAAQRLYEQSRQPVANTPANMFAPPKAKAGFDDELIDSVMGTVRGIYNNAMADRAIQSAPQLARGIQGRDGNAHPFSRVRPQDYSAAMQLGDAEGYQRIGDAMGVDANAAQTILAGGPTGQAWLNFAKSQEGPKADYNNWTRQLTIMQTQAMFKHLDASPSARDGFRPSAALADLMGNPEFQRTAVQAMQQQGGGTLGDFITSSVGGNGASQAFLEYANSLTPALQAGNAQQIKDQRQRIAQMRGDPMKRAGAILASIPGISPSDEQTLLAAVKEQTGYGGFDSAMDLGNRATTMFGDYDSPHNNAFDDVIMNHKFEDPKIEAIRRRAASKWSEISPKADTMIGRLLGD